MPGNHQFRTFIKKLLLVRHATIGLVSACLLLGLAGPLSSAWGCADCAGPGSNVYVRTHLIVENNILKRLDISWEFDEALAQSLLTAHDTNQDGRFDTEEKLTMGRNFIQEIQTSDYHTTLFVQSHKLKPLSFENASLTWHPEAPGLRFSIPLQKRIKDGLRLRQITRDPKHYLQFYHVQDSVTWNSPACCRLTSNAHLFPKELEMNILPLE